MTQGATRVVCGRPGCAVSSSVRSIPVAARIGPSGRIPVRLLKLISPAALSATLEPMKRTMVVALARMDGVLDAVLYRPAVVKAFLWLPRWWLCDLAKWSMRLDDHWGTGYWESAVIAPADPCEACGRRASVHVYGGPIPDAGAINDYMESHPVHVCGWCHLERPMLSKADVDSELALARADSVAWRWRWSALRT